jgi:hypothetical protein
VRILRSILLKPIALSLRISWTPVIVITVTMTVAAVPQMKAIHLPEVIVVIKGIVRRKERNLLQVLPKRKRRNQRKKRRGEGKSRKKPRKEIEIVIRLICVALCLLFPERNHDRNRTDPSSHLTDTIVRRERRAME